MTNIVDYNLLFQIFNRLFSMIRERILKYLTEKDISKYKFYQTTGFSNGFLDKNSTIGVDKCEIIISCYPDISLNWLITGKGEMLISSNKDADGIKHEEKVEWYNEQLNRKASALAEMMEQYNKLIIENAELKKQLEVQSKSNKESPITNVLR